MKKLLGFVSALLAVTMLGTACTPAKKNTDDETGDIVIKVGNWPTTEGVALDTSNQQKATFEEANPGIVIEPDTWAYDLKTFYPKAEAGTLPDVYISHFTEIPKLIDGEYVADLTNVMKTTGYYDKMNTKLLELVSKDGKVYAFPKKAYMLGLAVNMDAMEQAGLVETDGTPMQPKDWTEMAEFAVKLKEATGKPGFAFPTTSNCGGWYFTNIAWSFGVDFMEQRDDGTWEATFNTDEAVSALEFIKDLKWKYDVLPANVLIDAEELFKLYSTGGAGMIISSTDVLSRAKTYEMDKDDFGMVAIPAGPKKHVSLLGGTLSCTPNGTSERKLEAIFKWYDHIGNGYKFDDNVKGNVDKSIQNTLTEGGIVGVKSFSVWNDDAEIQKYTNEATEKNANINLNHVKLYNESYSDENVEVQMEEPVCAQDLYGILDGIIQEVLNNKNADCRALIEQANSDFQVNFLDKLDY